MRREARLRRTKDFERARASGRGWSHADLACYVLLREERGPTRVGIIVSRRVGSAVVRNRVRRRLREAVRALYPTLAANYDVVLTARPPLASAAFQQVSEATSLLLGRAGLIEHPAEQSPTGAPGRVL